MKTFSEKVREARQSLKLTQEELGALIGVSKRAVLAYETQGVRPRQNVKVKLAEALRVSTDYLDRDEIDDPTYGWKKQAISRRRANGSAAGPRARWISCWNATPRSSPAARSTRRRRTPFSRPSPRRTGPPRRSRAKRTVKIGRRRGGIL